MFLIELLQSLDYVQIIEKLTSPITEQETNAELSHDKLQNLTTEWKNLKVEK